MAKIVLCENRLKREFAGAAKAVAALVYKISTAANWREAEQAGAFRGAGVDLTDGYIHLSAPGQVVETAERHFAGQRDLMLVAVDSAALGPALKWEAARDGALFPHLYGPLGLHAVVWTKPLPLDRVGRHVFPELVP